MNFTEQTINLQTVQPKRYDFKPQDDITALESAWIAHFFAMLAMGQLLNAEDYPEWEQIKRHFKEI